MLFRSPTGVPQKVRALVDYELRLIAELGYEAFFLTVHDVVRFARERGILCQGRGSAANSAVCYVLGITEVNPATHELLFARFISGQRQEPPDIDVDFCIRGRAQVIQYVKDKYGADRVAQIATFGTLKAKAAIKDVGRALGFSFAETDADRKSTRLNSSHMSESRMPSSA